MTDKTEAEKNAAERVDKAAWMNDQLGTRLHQNDVQPGITSSKDARKDNDYPVQGGKVARKPAADKP